MDHALSHPALYGIPYVFRTEHSAAQPQPNGDAEGTAGVAWQPLSRAAL